MSGYRHLVKGGWYSFLGVVLIFNEVLKNRSELEILVQCCMSWESPEKKKPISGVCVCVCVCVFIYEDI